MSKKVRAEYVAEERILKLAEPLEGVADHTSVDVTVTPVSPDADRAWLALEGSLSKEAGEDLARAVNELFPPWHQDE